MGPDRRDPLHPPEHPTPPRDRQEAERRIAEADQAIASLWGQIKGYKYRFDQRDSYNRERKRAIAHWEDEKGVCRTFLKGHPAPAPTGQTAAPAPPEPAPPMVLPLPALADLQRIEAFLNDGIRAAANEKRRRLSMPLEVAVEHRDVLRRYTQSVTGGNVVPLRQRSG